MPPKEQTGPPYQIYGIKPLRRTGPQFIIVTGVYRRPHFEPASDRVEWYVVTGNDNEVPIHGCLTRTERCAGVEKITDQLMIEVALEEATSAAQEDDRKTELSHDTENLLLRYRIRDGAWKQLAKIVKVTGCPELAQDVNRTLQVTPLGRDPFPIHPDE